MNANLTGFGLQRRSPPFLTLPSPRAADGLLCEAAYSPFPRLHAVLTVESSPGFAVCGCVVFMESITFLVISYQFLPSDKSWIASGFGVSPNLASVCVNPCKTDPPAAFALKCWVTLLKISPCDAGGMLCRTAEPSAAGLLVRDDAFARVDAEAVVVRCVAAELPVLIACPIIAAAACPIFMCAILDQKAFNKGVPRQRGIN